jgi:hypothetical protein
MPNAPRKYPNVPAQLAEHLWLAFLFAAISVTAVYVLHLWLDLGSLFVAAEIPTLVISTVAVLPEPRLRLRLPCLWISTAFLVWSANNGVGDIETARVFVVCATGLILLFWLVLAIRGSFVERIPSGSPFRAPNGPTLAAHVIANLLSLWGATLQVTFLAVFLTKPALIPLLSNTPAGIRLLNMIELIRLTSPFFVFPLGLWALGLFLYAALKLRQDPYVVPHLHEIVLRFQTSATMRLLGATFGIPIWLLLIIFGFLYHLIRKLFESFGSFLKTWLGRLCLMIVSLLVPTLLLLAGHSLTWYVVSLIAHYLQSVSSQTFPMSIMYLILVHVLALFALSLYIASVAFLSTEITPCTLREALSRLRAHRRLNGGPAMDATGRAYVLHGTLIIAIPAGSALPGSYTLGTFSAAYIVLCVILLLEVWRREERSPLTALEHQIRTNFTRIDTEADGKWDILKHAFVNLLGAAVSDIFEEDGAILFNSVSGHVLVHPWPFLELSPRWKPYFDVVGT